MNTDIDADEIRAFLNQQGNYGMHAYKALQQSLECFGW